MSIAETRWRTGRGVFFSLWAGGVLWFALTKWQTLHDPHFWDSLGCYVFQARFMSIHRLDLKSYVQLPFVRPPLFTGLLAWFMALFGGPREMLRVVTWVFGALILPGTFAVTRELGGGRRAAWLALGLCALSPLCFAQAGLVQSDLPATALCTLAWALLLSGRTWAFVLFASLAVLTKESAYFICAPAAVLLYLRAARPEVPPFLRLGRLELQLGASLRALPAAIPAVVLALWELCHLLVLGYVMHPLYKDAIAPNYLPDALIHNYLEGGRVLLLPLAVLTVLAVLRPQVLSRRGIHPQPQFDRLGVLATAVGILVLPLAFCAPLPRYMLLSLPLLCALGGIGGDHLLQLRRLGALRPLGALGVLLCLVAGFFGRSWHASGGHHADANLAYRELLALHAQAARELSQARPRSVLATFPMFTVITAPPEDGYLPAPLPARVATGAEPLADLCQSDYLVEALPGVPIDAAVAALTKAAALSLWKQVGEGEWVIRIYKVRCPQAQPR